MDVGLIGRVKRNRSSISKEHGQQLGTEMANNFMLLPSFSIVADMAENPEGLRTDVKKTLLDLTDCGREAAQATLGPILGPSSRRALLLNRSLFNSPGSRRYHLVDLGFFTVDGRVGAKLRPFHGVAGAR
jgi:hypothetical protein